jgi:hypothetical protein
VLSSGTLFITTFTKISQVISYNVRVEIFTVMKIQVEVFWEAAGCSETFVSYFNTKQ